MVKNTIQKIIKSLPEGVHLTAVSKTYPAEIINEAIDAGVTDIGENKVQEVLAKYDAVKPVRWHFIGHLQTNKVKQIVSKVDIIESVDSVHLADEINKRCMAIQKVMDVLIQVNAAHEEQKSGIDPDQLDALAEHIASLSNLRLRGLMFVAPDVENREDDRKYFKQLKVLFDQLKGTYGEEIDTLSMGMSQDYTIAVEEGSTAVRIGTAIFGQRDYSKK